MLGVLQPDVRQAGAAVDRLVNAVAIADAALAVVLARAHPDHRWFGIDHDGADGVRAVVVEDRRPGGARVCRLPHAAGADRDVPDIAVLRIDGNVDDPPDMKAGPILS